MRKPLTRQNSTRDKRRYSAYQNRIFFYLVTLVTAPLLLLGVLSSVVYYRQTVTRSDALLASARENVETQMEIALSNLRAYYSAVVSADNYQTLCQKTVPPYSEYTLVRDMQTAMRGGNLVDKYVEGYTYINLRSGWILSNNGMYRLADAANRDEVAHLLSEWAEQHAAMMWVNRTDQPTPALADTPLNTVDLPGELLGLRSSSYRTGSYAVLIVKLDLSSLYEMTESWQTGGYSIAARDFTGKTVLSTSAALAALLAADAAHGDGCGWLSSRALAPDGTDQPMNLQRKTMYRDIDGFDAAEVPAVMASFVSLFLRTEAVRQFGLPIAEFFIWSDDWEYTRRISRAKPCYVIPASRVVHAMQNPGVVNIARDVPARWARYRYFYRNDVVLYRREGLSGWLWLLAKDSWHTIQVLRDRQGCRAERIKIIWKGFAAGVRFRPQIPYLP